MSYEQQAVCCEKRTIEIAGMVGDLHEMRIEFDGHTRQLDRHVLDILCLGTGEDGYIILKNYDFSTVMRQAMTFGKPNAPKPAKAIANAYYKHFGENLPTETIQKLGELFGQLAGTKQYTYDITSELAWRPGTYGEYCGSCWWGDYNDARVYTMPKALGMAIRTYKGRDGNARMWLVPLWHPDNTVYWNSYSWPGTMRESSPLGYVGFNSYGYPPGLFAKLLMHRLGELHPDVKFKMDIGNVNVDIDNGYDNGSDSTFLVAPENDAVWEWLDSNKLNLPVYVGSGGSVPLPYWAEDDEYGESRWDNYCVNCGDGLMDEDTIWGPDDEPRCESCHDQRFCTCETCGSWEWNDEMVSVRTGHGTIEICRDCVENYTRYCDHCGDTVLVDTPRYYRAETVGVDDVYLDNGNTETWCLTCIEDSTEVVQCEECNRNMQVPKEWEHRICEECFSEREEEASE